MILIVITLAGSVGYKVRSKKPTSFGVKTARMLFEATAPEKVWAFPDIDAPEEEAAGHTEKETEKKEDLNAGRDAGRITEDITTSSATFITCPNCGGMGRFTCGICGGSGQQYIPNMFYDPVMGWTGGYQGCGGCGGSGGTVCPSCGGSGQVLG